MVKYDPASRRKRADSYIATLAGLTDLRHRRVLEIGPHLGDLSIRLATDFGCEVVGIDPMSHPEWPAIQTANPGIRFVEGDIAAPPGRP